MPAKLRLRNLMNVLKMGHCAPTVMRTVREAQGVKDGRDAGSEEKTQ